MTSPVSAVQILSLPEWQERRRCHADRLQPWVEPHLERQSHAVKHPVYDFLFEYYSFRPSHLMSWSPGVGVLLRDATPEDLPMSTAMDSPATGVSLDARHFPSHRLRSLEWVIDLLKATDGKAPRFGCYGLHEWAMVYRDTSVRHKQTPLRLSHEAIARLVEEQVICCSHYDAYRFFTAPAKPLNQLRPTGETRSEMEQPGCLHANMDLYKWAYKFYPWVSSDLIADAFLLAVEIRVLDMRASPYDLAAFGFSPIPIESEAGRHDYQEQQKDVTRKAEPIRAELLRACEGIRSWLEQPLTMEVQV